MTTSRLCPFPLALTIALMFGPCACAQPETSASFADMVLVHGKILTVDDKDTIAEGLAIRQGKIVSVGSDSEILKSVGPATKVIDLHGKTATPGLIDTHGHFADGGTSELYHVDLSDAASIQDVLLRVKTKIVTLKPGEWLIGDGWDEGKLAERRYVYAADLDKVSPANPVWLLHTTGHYGAANSLALKLAGITSATQNPVAGTIDKDPAGNPSGVLKEAAMARVTSLVPETTPEQERAGILRIVDELHHEGMTSVKDADIEPHTWDAYRKLLDDNLLTVRVFVLWHAGTTMDSAQQTLKRINAQPKPPLSLGDGKLFSGGAKLYMDGSGGGRTAWLYKEWNKNFTGIDKGNYGYPAADPEVYRQEVRLFHQAGVTVGTHAIGDRAIDWVVDTYALVLKEKPTAGLRHTIIHSNIPSNHAIETMATLEKKYDAGYPESQPTFIWWIGDTYAGNFGPERSLRLNPYKTYLEKGVRWGGGSDYFVTPFAARYGIWSSIERKTLKGTYGTQPFGTAEAVDVKTALRSYTSWAAHDLFLEDKVGTLEIGKHADIAVWDKDFYAMNPDEIKDIRCMMTIFDGKLVYTANGKQ
jgi:predicted amidohydrolase YtcJ